MVAMGRSLPGTIGPTFPMKEALVSVIVTLVAHGDPKAMERIAAEDPAGCRRSSRPRRATA
jgi:hypothetical protein